MNAPHDDPPPPSRFAGLDTLRGFAVLRIVLYHFSTRYHELYGHSGAATYEMTRTDFSVPMFFVISGFVIPLTLAKSGSLLDFVFLRFTRLYPVFWICVALTFTAMALRGLPGQEVTAGGLLVNLTMVPGALSVPYVDGAYWTLPVELSFYAIMAVLMALRQLDKAAVVFLCIAAAHAASARLHVMTVLRGSDLCQYAHLFAIGILLHDWRAKRRAWHPWAFASVWVIAFLDRGPGYLIWIALFFTLTALSVFTDARILRIKPLVWLGALSYPLYLLHQQIGYIILRATDAAGINSYAGIAMAFGVVLALAYGVHRLVERPAMAWSRGLRRRLRAQQAGAQTPRAITARPGIVVAAAAVVLAALLGTGLLLVRREGRERDLPVDAALDASTRQRPGDAGPGTALEMSERYPRGLSDVARLGRKKNILFLMIGSLRGDTVNDELTPGISRYAARHGCLVSDRHYAGSPATGHGLFSAMYGLDAHHFLPFQRSSPTAHPLEILKANGYRLAGASARGLTRGGGAAFVVKQLGDYREIIDESAEDNDRRLVERAKELVARRMPGDDPFFMFLFFDSARNSLYPPAFERFTPALPAGERRVAGTAGPAVSAEMISNRYRNSLGYIDHLFGALAESFADLIARDDLVVVLTGDHGGEFPDDGLPRRGDPGFIDARARVPLVLCLPGEPRRTVPLSSHADIFPTLLDYARPGAPFDPALHFSGRTLLSDQTRDRMVVMSAPGFPSMNGEITAVRGAYKYLFVRRQRHLREGSLRQITTLDDEPAPRSGHDEILSIVDRTQARIYQFLK